MIWVISVLLLLVGGGLAVPINGSQVAEVNSNKTALHETVKGVQMAIQVLYNKLQVVENQLKNGESSWGGWKEHLQGVGIYNHSYDVDRCNHEQ